jgi:hypothetical protein
VRSQIWISPRGQFCVKVSHLFVTLLTSLGNIVIIIFICQTDHYMKLYALRASPVHPFMFHGLPEIVLIWTQLAKIIVAWQFDQQVTTCRKMKWLQALDRRRRQQQLRK